jgi:hypothetical protein
MAGIERNISDGVEGMVDAYERGLDHTPRQQDLQQAVGSFATRTQNSNSTIGAELRGDVFDCGGLREDINWLPEQPNQYPQQ